MESHRLLRSEIYSTRVGVSTYMYAIALMMLIQMIVLQGVMYKNREEKFRSEGIRTGAGDMTADGSQISIVGSPSGFISTHAQRHQSLNCSNHLCAI